MNTIEQVVRVLESAREPFTLDEILEEMRKAGWKPKGRGEAREVRWAITLALEDPEGPVVSLGHDCFCARTTLLSYPLDWFSVRHSSTSPEVDGFKLPKLVNYDAEDPPVTHRFQVVMALPAAEDDDDRPRGVGGLVVAELRVREFPVNLMMWEPGTWTQRFSMFYRGVTPYVGAMIDDLVNDPGWEVRLGGWAGEGSIFLLQNLEVRPDLRRRGMGTSLVRYSMGFLTRSTADLFVAEAAPIGPMVPGLDEGDDCPTFESPGVIRAFMQQLGFEVWRGGEDSVRTVAALGPLVRGPDTGRADRFFLQPRPSWRAFYSRSLDPMDTSTVDEEDLEAFLTLDDDDAADRDHDEEEDFEEDHPFDPERGDEPASSLWTPDRVVETVSMLVRPLAELDQLRIAFVIGAARDLGATHARRNEEVYRGIRSNVYFPGAEEYWAQVVVALRDGAIVSEEEVEAWQAQARDSLTLRDPRVQAFCSAWSETAAGIAADVASRRDALSELEFPELEDVDLSSLVVQRLTRTRLPIFGTGNLRMMILDGKEADELAHAALSAGMPTEDLGENLLDVVLRAVEAPPGKVSFALSLDDVMALAWEECP